MYDANTEANSTCSLFIKEKVPDKNIVETSDHHCNWGKVVIFLLLFLSMQCHPINDLMKDIMHFK